jgi:ABC-type sugar transport system substrate-binding protein
MRIMVTGDRYWPCHLLAEPVLRRLIARHGQGIVIVHGDSEGVDEAFAKACTQLGVTSEPHLTAWDDLSQPDARIMTRFDGTKYDAQAGPRRNAEMIAQGADMCLVIHRNLKFSVRTKECARQVTHAGIKTWLIESTLGNLDPLNANDPRLK